MKKQKKEHYDYLDQYNDWRLWRIDIPFEHIDGKIRKDYGRFPDGGIIKFHPWGDIKMAEDKAEKNITRTINLLKAVNKHFVFNKIKVFCYIAGIPDRKEGKSDDPKSAKLLQQKLSKRFK